MLKLCHCQRSQVISWDVFYRLVCSQFPLLRQRDFLHFPPCVGCKELHNAPHWPAGPPFICLKTNSKITVLIDKHWDALGLNQWFSSQSGLNYTVKKVVDSCHMPTRCLNRGSCWVCCGRLIWSLADQTFIRKVLQAAVLVHSETNLLLLCWSPLARFQFSGQGGGGIWQRKAIKQWLFGNYWLFYILCLSADHAEISLQIFRYP